MRTRTLVIAVQGICLLGAAIVLLRQPVSSAEPASSMVGPAAAAATTPVATPASPKTGAPEPQSSDSGAAAAAKATVRRMMEESASVLAQRPPPSRPRIGAGNLEAFAVGPALEEIVAQAEYNANQKWAQSGQARVVWVKVDPAKSNATSMTASVCLDSSDVVVRDATGAPLPPSPHSRTINLYALRKQSGTWKITEHSFPTQPDC